MKKVAVIFGGDSSEKEVSMHTGLAVVEAIKDIYDVIKKTHVSGVSLSSILHYGIAKSFKNKNFEIGNLNYLENIKYNKKKPQNFLKSIKLFLKKKGIHVRI